MVNQEVEREGLNLKALQMGWRSHKAMARGDTEAPEVSAFRKLREDLHQQQTMMAFRAFKVTHASSSPLPAASLPHRLPPPGTSIDQNNAVL